MLRAGDVISLDGTTGHVYAGAVPVHPSPVVRYFEGELAPESDPLIGAVHRLMGHADAVRRLGVHANADTGADAARARRFGATGVGLCRTEHMFLGERRALVERLILAVEDTEREAALADLLPLQRADFADLFTAMDGLPVTIRLIDPPLHEFLPPLEDLTATVARAEALGRDPGRDGRAADGRTPHARGQPDARPARRTPRPGRARPVRHAGPRHRGGRGAAGRRRRRPATGDHGAAGRHRAGARDGTHRSRSRCCRRSTAHHRSGSAR